MTPGWGVYEVRVALLVAHGEATRIKEEEFFFLGRVDIWVGVLGIIGVYMREIGCE